MSENVADPLSFSNVTERRWYRHSGLSTQTAYVAAAFGGSLAWGSLG